jgi:hypothetical protein
MKKWAYGIVIIVACLLVTLGGILSGKYLFKTSNHNETKYGTWRISLKGWDSDQTNQFRLCLSDLNRLGPTFRLVEEGTPRDVLVENSNTVNCLREAGSYSVLQNGSRYIALNPTCTRGNLELRTAFMHEIGHSLGMMHILRSAGEQADYVSPIGRYGFAILNPRLVYSNGDDAVPTEEIQPLDIQEFIRSNQRH